MSFSMPITSKPASTKWATDSEPISPPEPVTIGDGHARLAERRADGALVVVTQAKMSSSTSRGVRAGAASR